MIDICCRVFYAIRPSVHMKPVNPLIHPRAICVEKICSFKIIRIRVEEARWSEFSTC